MLFVQYFGGKFSEYSILKEKEDKQRICQIQRQLPFGRTTWSSCYCVAGCCFSGNGIFVVYENKMPKTDLSYLAWCMEDTTDIIRSSHSNGSPEILLITQLLGTKSLFMTANSSLSCLNSLFCFLLSFRSVVFCLFRNCCRANVIKLVTIDNSLAML